MTVRGADYPRRKNDDYPTPPEVIDVLFHAVRFSKNIMDPCCGRNRTVLYAARRHGYHANGYDIINGFNFIEQYNTTCNADVVTNPPYGGRSGKLALGFIEKALKITERRRRKVAMLLPVDFDSGRTRRHVFEHPAFALKIVLLDRIKWFDGKSGSTNHAWYVWSWKHKGYPAIKYARIESE